MRCQVAQWHFWWGFLVLDPQCQTFTSFYRSKWAWGQRLCFGFVRFQTCDHSFDVTKLCLRQDCRLDLGCRCSAGRPDCLESSGQVTKPLVPPPTHRRAWYLIKWSVDGRSYCKSSNISVIGITLHHYCHWLMSAVLNTDATHTQQSFSRCHPPSTH